MRLKYIRYKPWLTLCSYRNITRGVFALENLIELNNVTKRYYSESGDILAIDNISMKIGEGEFIAVVGHSGSGKSTLMNILGCLDSQTEGDYFLKGKDVSQIDENTLAKLRNKYIGFVFQRFNLLPGLTALENVELPLSYDNVPPKIRRQKALKVLEDMDMLDRASHYPNQLSGGQQQRIAIARAVVASPSLILADEPTGNLDPHSEEQVINILKMLNEQGRTVIIITHNEYMAKCAKRRVEICNGKIINDKILS